tara:strand:+ start:3496 stop:5001 length:1506 start_codon:yes stop_codon:yes gene_type:complete
MAIITDTLRAVMALDETAPVIDHKDVWYTWGKLNAQVNAISELLTGLDVPAGGRVGVLLHNRPGHVAAILSVLASDRCLVTLNPLYPDETLAGDIGSLAVPVVIGEAADLARPGILAALEASGAAIIEIDPLLGGTVRKTKGRGELPNESGSRAIAIEMLTSGTTGKPKRVPLTRAAFDASFAAVAKYEKSRELTPQVKLRDNTTLIINPVTHIGGIYGVIGALMAGRRICLVERFSVENWAHAVVRHRPKVAPGVPAALRMILEANLPADTFSSLSAIISGTAPLDPTIVDEFLTRYDLPILGNYGATEFAGAIAGWSLKDFRLHWNDKRGAAGKLHHDVTARIVDAESGAPVAPGVEGLLELKAPQLGDAKSWRRTTDRAVLDADRFLFIKGRADNAIVRGGFKIHPDDVVRVLEQHPAIREAAVVGIPDSRLGEVPVAAIILADGAALPPDADLKAYLKDKLLPYQTPVRFLAVHDLPRTASMKPAVVQIRKLFETSP